MYRIRGGVLEVLLGHPGGPFWRNKDTGTWSIPKGETEGDEDLLAAAKREFEEETSIVPQGTFVSLGTVQLKSGKIVHGWAFEGDCDTATIKSNNCTVEWPPHSGKIIEVPELDHAEFWSIPDARTKIGPAQVPFLERLEALLKK